MLRCFLVGPRTHISTRVAASRCRVDSFVGHVWYIGAVWGEEFMHCSNMFEVVPVGVCFISFCNRFDQQHTTTTFVKG